MQTPARVTKGKGKAGKAGKGHANADIPTKRVQVKIDIADFTITILSTHPKSMLMIRHDAAFVKNNTEDSDQAFATRPGFTAPREVCSPGQCCCANASSSQPQCRGSSNGWNAASTPGETFA